MSATLERLLGNERLVENAAFLLRRLPKEADDLAAALREAGGQEEEVAARKAGLELATRFESVRPLGLLIDLSEADRRALLIALGADEATRRRAGELARELAGQAGLCRGLAWTLPSWFQAAEVAWEPYRRHLSAAPDEPIWGETGVSLSQIYVPPDFTEYERTEEEVAADGLERHGDALTRLCGLLTGEEGPPERPVFVFGGPGIGKTSLARMLAARLAGDGKAFPVFVRLRDLDPFQPLLAQVTSLLEGAEDATVRRETPFPEVARTLRRAPALVLILDGFDELARAVYSGLAQFFQEATDLLGRPERRGDTAIVLTGRDTLFAPGDTAVPQGARVLTLQPFSDEQVASWSAGWEAATGRELDGAAAVERVPELARQPLLLYLLAWSGVDPAGAGASRAGLYRSVITHVCRRHQDLRPDDAWDARTLRRYLQAAGFAALALGQEHLHWSDLQGVLDRQGLAREDESDYAFEAQRTILSFLFHSPEHACWEFTHKSFGEYLAAEHLYGTLAKVLAREEDEFGEPDYVATAVEAAHQWSRAFGVARLSREVESLVLALVREEAHGRLAERLEAIYPHVVREECAETQIAVARDWGLRPTEVVGRTTENLFLLRGRLAREAGERWCPALVAPGTLRMAHDQMVLAGVRSLQRSIRIWSGTRLEGGERELARPRVGTSWLLPSADASGLNLEEAVLIGLVLSYGSLRGAKLSRADLSLSFLTQVDLAGADLKWTDLSQAWLMRANLEGADLRNADLSGASLRGARLGRADLRGAHLTRADLSRARLDDARLDDDPRRALDLPTTGPKSPSSGEA